MRPPDSRRLTGVLSLLTCAFLAGALVPSPAQARQEPPAPARAQGMDAVSHPPPAAGGAAEEPEAALKVTSRVLCMCGGCVNQTLHECTCGTAAQERAAVAAKIAAGETPEQVIKAYVDEYGLQILSTPEKKGFNLVGWLVPFIVAVVLLTVLTLVLKGWVKPPALEPIPSLSESSTAPADPIERGYRERLERELKDFEA